MAGAVRHEVADHRVADEREVAYRVGHPLHTEFAAKILEETNAWRLVEAPFDAPAPMAIPATARAPRLAN